MRFYYMNRLCLITVLISIGILGCMGRGTPPIDRIANVEMIITQARENDADQHAPLELKLAGEKMIEAKVLMDNKHYNKARQKAEEALMDATLAESKARAAKAKKLAQEMQDSVETLRREIDRSIQSTTF